MNNLFDKAKLLVTLCIEQRPMVSSSIYSFFFFFNPTFLFFPISSRTPGPGGGSARPCPATGLCGRDGPRHRVPDTLVAAPLACWWSRPRRSAAAAPAPRSAGQAASLQPRWSRSLCRSVLRASEHVRARALSLSLPPSREGIS